MAQSADIELIKPYTKSTIARIDAMASALCTIDEEKIAGDVVECGVWKGGNIMLSRLMCPERSCWLFDTFDGMTEPDPELDVKRSGERAIDRYNQKKADGTKWDAISLDEVQAGFMMLGIDMKQLHFVSGPVEKSLDVVAPLRIAILRLDLDWHSPTKAALEKLYRRISPNGFLIVDDYGHWMGCKKAVDDFFLNKLPPHMDADYSCRVFRKC